VNELFDHKSSSQCDNISTTDSVKLLVYAR